MDVVKIEIDKVIAHCRGRQKTQMASAILLKGYLIHRELGRV